ncbi:MAG TPA: DMT family transporter [Methylocella sp.]|nr:DMT family transporter [Methylocella sp.]
MNRQIPAGETLGRRAPDGWRSIPDKASLDSSPGSARKQSIRAGILWMLAATGLFVCQDSTARILVKAYPATEIAFVRYFVHMVLVGAYIAWRDPRLFVSRQPVLQMLRSGFLLGTTLFGMLALKIMPLVDFSAVVWVAPVLVTALSGLILHEKVSPAAWVSVIAGLAGVWIVIGPGSAGFSFALLFPFFAALSNAFYQLTTRLLHRADLPMTTLFYTALAGVLYCGGFLPFSAILPNEEDSGLMLFLGLAGAASHFCLIRAFSAAPANIIAPFGYTALLWAALFSLVLFAELPGLRAILGAGLIAGAGLFIYLKGRTA